MNIGILALAMSVSQPTAYPPGIAGPPIMPASPFLFVKVTGEKGDQAEAPKVTWHPLSSESTTTNSTVGLRPGYLYRFAFSDFPDAKGTVLYPSIEIRGTLIPRPGIPDVAKHPVPIAITERDIDQILNGRFITKIYYLEDPESAIPIEGKAGEALENSANSEEDAITEARLRGRPMLILRIGERPSTKEELARENVPGTILFPGAKQMPMPAAPPIFPFGAVMLYDPLLGPKAAAEECLNDGGDIGARLGEGPNRTIGGLDPTDTAMMYTTRKGTRVIASNRVGICVPRFVAARVGSGPTGHHSIHGPEAKHTLQPVSALDVRMLPGNIRGTERLVGLIGSKRINMMQSQEGPASLIQWSGRPAGLASIKGVSSIAMARGPEEITAYKGHVLLLEKSINPKHAEKIGDVVTITLKFSNPTTEEMSDIFIADSLTGRLEYVEGSTKSTYPTTFTATANKAGSVVLRWSVDGTLKPGESGTITFQVKIR